MNFPEIYSATGMMELIQQIGFLPLLDSGVGGFSAEDIVAEDCRYAEHTKQCRKEMTPEEARNTKRSKVYRVLC